MAATLGPEDLTRIAAPIYADLLAVDPDVHVTSSSHLGTLIYRDLLVNARTYETLLPNRTDVRTALCCLCRLSLSSLILRNTDR